MTSNRIFAIMLRSYYATKRSLDRSAEVFFMPFIDLVLWGVTSSYLSSFVTGNSKFLLVTAVVAGLVFWQIAYRLSNDVPMNTLEDLWNRNLINSFASPLTFGEWIGG